METLCDLLGHKLPKGYANDVPYLTIKTIITDGINRKHAFLYAVCARCGKEYQVAYTHLPANNNKEGNQNV